MKAFKIICIFLNYIFTNSIFTSYYNVEMC